MWQPQSQKNRVISPGKKRERDRFRDMYHVKRINAEFEVVSKSDQPELKSTARIILNDFSVQGGGFFCQKFLTQGSEVKISISSPQKLEILGKVVWCQEHNVGTHILSEMNFTYRTGIEFLISSPAEAEAIQNFYVNLINNYLHSRR